MGPYVPEPVTVSGVKLRNSVGDRERETLRDRRLRQGWSQKEKQKNNDLHDPVRKIDSIDNWWFQWMWSEFFGDGWLNLIYHEI